MSRIVLLALFASLFIAFLLIVNNLDQSDRSGPLISDPQGTESDSKNAYAYAGWKEFVAQNGKFKVLLPDSPQYAQDVYDIPGTRKKRLYDMYAAPKVNGAIFMISRITYPPDYDISNSDLLLKELITEMVESNTKNRLINTSHSVFHDNKAYDFTIENDEFNIKGKAFLEGQIAYLLTYAARKNDFDDKEYQHFLESFKILPDSPEQT